MQLFSDGKAWWSKEPQWENNYGSFSHSFLKVMEIIPQVSGFQCSSQHVKWLTGLSNSNHSCGLDRRS